MTGSPVRMTGRVCVVTGANSGVGLEVARGLARSGATVVMAVRDLEKGARAQEEVLASAPGAALHAMRLDLMDLESVRQFARELSDAFPALHVLVNNAGIHTSELKLSPQGYESTFATNHLGHFLLTHELLPLLRKGAPSRIVNVASQAHLGARSVGLDRVRGEGSWSGIRAYTRSKLANIMFTYALARRVEGTGVTANAVHPGSVRTGWARGSDSGLFRLAVWASTPFLVSPETGARSALRAATDPALEGVNGRYFLRSGEAKSSKVSYDVGEQDRLWQESAKMCGIDWP